MNYYTLLAKKAAAYPSRLFLRVDCKSYTYGQFLAYVDELARMTHHQKGITPIASQDIVDQYARFFAYQKLGTIPLLIHPELLEADRRALDLSSNCSSSACMAVLSSGSTGTPKVMYRTYDSWATFFPIQNEAFSIADGCRLFLHGSFSFTGNLNVALAILYAGGSIITSSHFHPATWLDMIDSQQVRAIYLVPAKLKLLIKHDSRPIQSVTSIFTGSQIVTNQLSAALENRFPQSTLWIYYGASEVSYISYRCWDKKNTDVTDVGCPFPGVTVVEKDGLLYIDSPWHISGLSLPYTLKDKGHVDANGHIHFEGRQSQWINKSGYKLSCAKVEMLLKSITGIDDALVYAIDDELRGQDIGACVVAAAGASQEALARKIRQTLPPIAVPAKITWVKGIVLNDRGKPDIHLTSKQRN